MNVYSTSRKKPGHLQVGAFQFVSAAVCLWLLSGFWQLQVQSPDVYAARAERNRIKSLPLLAPRGKIMDRDGRILVDNSPTFKVLLSRAAMRQESLPLIAEGLNIPYEQLRTQLRRLRTSNAPEYQAVILKENLAPGDIAFVESHRAEFPELELIRSQKRLYPKDGLASHVVGYVGEISDAELEQLEFALYEPGAEVGKAGIERQYNDILTGSDGRRVVVVDNLGREREVRGNVEAKAGRGMRLTIDLDLQVVSELAMEGKTGAVVALDPGNGDVLALVSRPNYLPNKFVGGISVEDWRQLVNDPQKPMLNRPIQAQLAPGSIFKPIVALAAARNPFVDKDFSVVCKGGASFHGRYFRCHKKGGHGRVTLHDALVRSCDVYFYTLGNRLGIDSIAETSLLVGFGEPTGIDLPHEEDGTVPSKRWKLRFFHEKWYAGETISVAIGQGALTTTPLQIASAMGGLALGGEWHQPHLVPHDEMQSIRQDFQPPAPRRAELDPSAVREIVRGLWGVVNEAGTGVRSRIPGYDVCGKTGTAQVVSRQYAKDHDEEASKDNAWFVGFAPCEAPEIVVVALHEHGEHGSIAAPIVRDVIKAYFDKKQRTRWTQRRSTSTPEQTASNFSAPAPGRDGP